MSRKIIHVDADAFYASVEQRDNPALRGKPVVVGGSPDSRGVVCAASYEAREYGVRSAMPCSRAFRLCPAAVFIRPDFARYREASSRIHAIFRDYAELIQPLSLDEAYLDVTDDLAGLGSATRTAEAIRRRVREELRLTVSAGVAPSKLVAKIASDYRKPDGLTVVPPARVLEFLRPLPIRRVPGVGPVTEERLRAKGILHVGDLMVLEDGAFEGLFGSHADWFRQVARGEDDRPVRPPGRAKQVSIEDTVAEDLADLGACQRLLASLVDRLWDRLRKKERYGRTVTVKVKYGDFSQVTRSRTRADPYDTWRDVEAVRQAAQELLGDTEAGMRPVRLLGVGVSNFENLGATQLNLFEEEADPG